VFSHFHLDLDYPGSDGQVTEGRGLDLPTDEGAIGDAAGQLTSWHLTGVTAANSNEMRLYYHLDCSAGDGSFTLGLYKTSAGAAAKTASLAVAQAVGTSSTPCPGRYLITALNDSGINGSVLVTLKGAMFAVAVAPLYAGTHVFAPTDILDVQSTASGGDVLVTTVDGAGIVTGVAVDPATPGTDYTGGLKRTKHDGAGPDGYPELNVTAINGTTDNNSDGNNILYCGAFTLPCKNEAQLDPLVAVNAATLRGILEQHRNVVACISGHEHVFRVSKVNGITHLSLQTMGDVGGVGAFGTISVYGDRTISMKGYSTMPELARW
jgi:hypothetical protein